MGWPLGWLWGWPVSSRGHFPASLTVACRRVTILHAPRWQGWSRFSRARGRTPWSSRVIGRSLCCLFSPKSLRGVGGGFPGQEPGAGLGSVWVQGGALNGLSCPGHGGEGEGGLGTEECRSWCLCWGAPWGKGPVCGIWGVESALDALLYCIVWNAHKRRNALLQT